MLIINLYKFIVGYVEICILGDFCEKIINLFSVNHINFWNIKKNKNKIELCILIKDFKRIREIKRNTKVKIKIINKFGLPFIIKKYIKRIGLVVGLVLFFIIINTLSIFCWNVSVSGNKNVSENEILAACEEIGIKNGIKLKGLNMQQVREKLLLNCSDLSWSSLNIEGSKITVNVTEINKENKKNSPANIIADYSGSVKEIYVETGSAEVKKGDSFVKGDILVSGVENYGSNNKFVEAKAHILAEISDIIEVNGNFSRENTYLNGNKLNKYVLEFFNVKIPLYLGQVKGEFIAEGGHQNLYLFKQKMPIKIYKKTFNFLNKENIILTREELLIELSHEIDEKFNSIEAQDKQIVFREINETNNEIVLKYHIKYVKNVGVKENLLFDVSN